MAKPRKSHKIAPPGYYTSKEARERLGMATSTFIYYVKIGRIERHIPPLKKEGYYLKKEIDQLATQMALFLHTATTEEAAKTTPRVARSEDAQGIHDVLASFGWQTATPAQRVSWYEVNASIDYVVTSQGKIAGYITAVPYTPAALTDIMAGRRRAWHMTPADILPYEPGVTYDLYVGAAVRRDVANHTPLAFRLLAGFMDFLKELAAEKGIRIHHLYAVSAEPDGQRLCRALGFVEQHAETGDLFPRFALDLQESNSRFAEQYREALSH